MMDAGKSYLSNYLKIYLWQSLSMATSFLSMFVVVPQLSSRHSMFGIYSICISMTIFLSYADFGFMNSGFRYASESLAKNDLKKETQVVGFVSFILFVFVVLYALVVSAFAVNPRMLIADLTDPREVSVASALLTWLAVFSPVIVVQRMLQIIYGVRIEDYIYQRINIAGNLMKIASVFLFVNSSGYDIVGYFFICQLISALCSVISLIISKTRYKYDLALLLRSFRFSNEIFKATRRLAFGSLYVTVAWVLYYELDTLFLGRTLGADRLALYAVALALASFLRSILSTIYSPFRARMNHLVALDDQVRLRNYYRRVMVVTLPAILFPVISLCVLMKPLIFCWVGRNYMGSIFVAQLLILAYVDGFSSYPASFLLVAQERVRELYLIGSLSPIILWGGVLLAIRMLDITTFGSLKLLAAVPVQVFSLVISKRCLGMSIFDFFKDVIGPAVLPSVSLIAMLLYLRDYMPLDKSHGNVAVVVATGGMASIVALLVYFWRSSAFRQEVHSVLSHRVFGRNRPIVGSV